MRLLNFLVMILLLFFISCKSETKRIDSNSDIRKKHDYRVLVEIGNPFSGYLKRIVINNSDQHSPLFYFGELKPFTLYFFQYKPERIENGYKSNKYDTTIIKLTYEQSDSVFYLANDFITKFKVVNQDKLNIDYTTTDDSYAKISIGIKERTLSATLEYLSIKEYNTKEYTLLMDYLMKFEKK
jgi:hypothetical protein